MVNTIELSPKDAGLTDTESSDFPWDDIAEYSDRESNNTESAEKLDEKEAKLKEELTFEYRKVAGRTKKLYLDVSNILGRTGFEESKMVLAALDHFAIKKDSYDDAILESMFDIVDEYYPSAESGKIRTPEEIRDKERKYLDANTDNGKYCSSVLEAVRDNFVIDDPENDKEAAVYIENISKDTMDQSDNFPAALLDYLKDPSREKESMLDMFNNNYIESIAKNTFAIAEYFNENKTSTMKRVLIEPVSAYVGDAQVDRSELHAKLKEYLDYKIQNTRDEYKPKIEEPGDSVDALPDDVIS